MAIAERELSSSAKAVRPYRWTREQFYRMGDAGLFEGQRVILIEGEILHMPPIGPQHQGLTTIIGGALRRAFGDGFVVREHAPFDIGAATDPEPDLAVVAGSERDYLEQHPTQAALIVEVSVSTLAYDRSEKASLYASVGIQDYWIVNPKSRQAEAHRQPTAEAGQPFGFDYAEIVTYRTRESIRPLEKPEALIPGVALLP